MFGVKFPPGTPPNEVVAVHPTQIYEVLMGTIMFFIVLRFRDHKHGRRLAVRALLLSGRARAVHRGILPRKGRQIFCRRIHHRAAYCDWVCSVWCGLDGHATETGAGTRQSVTRRASPSGRRVRLIAHDARRYHVSLDTVLELERAILADNRVAPVSSSPLTEAARAATRFLDAQDWTPQRCFVRADAPRPPKSPERDFFAVMMTVDPSLAAPWFVLPSRRSIYLFDAWPSQHLAIRSYVETWGIEYAFVSSSQAARRLASICDRCTFIWVPEGIEPSAYQQRSLADKDIDVLQLGRKFDAHHVVIAPALEKVRQELHV